MGRRDQAQAVGADEPDARPLGDPHDLFFELLALGAHLLETGRDDDDGLDVNLGAFLQYARHELSRDNDNHQIGRLPDRREVRIDLETLDLVGLGVDGVDFSRKAACDQVDQNLVSHLALLAGRPDDRNRLRVEKRLKTHAVVHPFLSRIAQKSRRFYE